MLETFLTTYGYPVLIIGAFFEGETVMILAGVAAHMGYLSLDWVIFYGFCGTLIGDQFYFYLGRRHGKSILAKHPDWETRASRVFNIMQRHQNLLILSFRFLYGIRTITPFAIGMSAVSYLRFTLLNITGAAIWASSIALAGYYFGRAVEVLLGDIRKYEIVIMAAIILIAALIWLILFYLRRKQS
jgi:membrane protein DedA with SNARE-associated domain